MVFKSVDEPSYMDLGYQPFYQVKKLPNIATYSAHISLEER